jgi:hypothetical protein
MDMDFESKIVGEDKKSFVKRLTEENKDGKRKQRKWNGRPARYSAPASCEEVKEICVRAGLFDEKSLTFEEDGYPIVAPIPIPPCWHTSPSIRTCGWQNFEAASLLAEVVTYHVLQSCKMSILLTMSEELEERREELGPKICSWHRVALDELLGQAMTGYRTSVQSIAKKLDINGYEISKALECLEQNHLITISDVMVSQEAISSRDATTGYIRYEQLLDFTFVIDIVTPKLAEITLLDSSAANCPTRTVDAFFYRLAEGQWKRELERGEELTFTYANAKYEFEPDFEVDLRYGEDLYLSTEE